MFSRLSTAELRELSNKLSRASAETFLKNLTEEVHVDMDCLHWELLSELWFRS